jgi:hypothetical protein
MTTSLTVSSVSASSWLHHFIIGKKGQNLAKITQQMPNIHSAFSEGEDKTPWKAPTEDVNVARSRLKAWSKT